MLTFLTSLDATAQVVAKSAATVVGYHLDNTANTVPTYFQFFNNQAPTVGTDRPDFAVAIPAGGAANIVWLPSSQGVIPRFANGITVAATTTATGNTAPGSDCTAVVMWT